MFLIISISSIFIMFSLKSESLVTSWYMVAKLVYSGKKHDALYIFITAYSVVHISIKDPITVES